MDTIFSRRVNKSHEFDGQVPSHHRVKLVHVLAQISSHRLRRMDGYLLTMCADPHWGKAENTQRETSQYILAGHVRFKHMRTSLKFPKIKVLPGQHIVVMACLRRPWLLAVHTLVSPDDSGSIGGGCRSRNRLQQLCQPPSCKEQSAIGALMNGAAEQRPRIVAA